MATNNKEKLAASKKRYAKKHAVQIAAHQKAYREKNKEKAREYRKNYYKTHPRKPRHPDHAAKVKPYLREFHLKHKYGMSESDYQQRLNLQNGRCAICGTNDPHGRKHNRFHVDHCHTTGVVRGLLCSRCNMGIGSFLDDVLLLKKAIEYLESHAHVR